MGNALLDGIMNDKSFVILLWLQSESPPARSTLSRLDLLHNTHTYIFAHTLKTKGQQ